MSLTTTAPLLLPERQHSMSYQSERDFASPSGGGGDSQGPGPGAYYSRPPSSHGASSHSFTHPDAQSSPDRNGSSHSQGQAFSKPLPTTTPQTPVYAHSQSTPHAYPATPISGPSYPVGTYYGISHSQSQDGHEREHEHEANIPSPPLSSERAPVANFTVEGNPLVPVGVSGGKMFQCRGYGQCDKVFTRSEHLARHVRKHTGERPFPCHCGKSFSRLDNLRQHATTVHSNETQLNSNMLDSLTPVHSALSARATREQRKRGEIVEVPKNAVERPRHGLQRSSLEGSVPPPMVTAAAYPPYADGGGPSGWNDHASRPRASTSSAYDYHQGVDIGGGLDSTPGQGPSRRPGSSSAGYVSASGYTSYYDGPSSRQPTGDSASSSKPLEPLGFPYRSMSASGRDLSHGHYADSEPPNSAHGLPESPMYAAPPPIPQPNWSSPPPHSGYGHEHRTFYHPAPTPEGYSYPEPSHTPIPGSSHSYGPPPPGSAGSGYGYPAAGAPPTPVHPNYFGPTQNYPSAMAAPAPPSTSHAPSGPGYSVSSYTPTSANDGSPFHFHGPSSTPLTGSTSLPAVSASADYTYPPTAATHNSLKRRLEDSEDTTTTVPNSSAAQFNSRKVPRSSLNLSSQPIRALQEHNPPGQDNDEQLWFPPTTERRSSLAISALLGSPQADHKPRAPWDGSGNGNGNGNGNAVMGTNGGATGGDMEEKAKALLGSAH